MGYQWPHKPYDAICHMSFLVLFPSPSSMWFIDLTWFNHPFWGELGNWGYMPLSPCHVARFILRSWVMLLLISIIISGRVVPPPCCSPGSPHVSATLLGSPVTSIWLQLTSSERAQDAQATRKDNPSKGAWPSWRKPRSATPPNYGLLWANWAADSWLWITAPWWTHEHLVNCSSRKNFPKYGLYEW